MALTPWDDIADAEIAQDEPFTEELALKYRAQMYHLKQVIVGDGPYRGRWPHAHRADESPLTAPYSGNLLKDFCPDDDDGGSWTRSGYTISNDNGIETTTTILHHAWQMLMYPAAVSKSAMGGADLTVSFTVKPKAGAPAAGELWFGIADGSSSAYKAGCKGVITASGITTTKRYYMQLAGAIVGTFSTDCRMLIRNGTTPPNAALYITGIDVRAGLVVPYVEPGMNENTAVHDDWAKFSVSRIFAKDVQITNVIAVVGV